MSDLIVIQCDIKKKQESRDQDVESSGSMCVLAACIALYGNCSGQAVYIRSIWRH